MFCTEALIPWYLRSYTAYKPWELIQLSRYRIIITNIATNDIMQVAHMQLTNNPILKYTHTYNT